MKRLLLYFAALVVMFSQSSCGYNGMVQRDQAVKTSWANVQSQYQRRADLIPNLVSTVKGAAQNERGTLEGVMEARAKATSVNISADNLTPENLQKFQAAQGQLSQGLGRLLAVAENYPQLQTNDNFKELQAKIEGTENRINVARDNFNSSVNDYNTFTRSFANNLFAGMFGFKPATAFEASDAAKDAPKVDFGDMSGKSNSGSGNMNSGDTNTGSGKF